MMKNHKKKIVTGIGLVSIFAVGTYTGANSSWFTTAINDANSKISQAGWDKKEEIIIKSPEDINKKVQELTGAEIDTKSAELQKMLEDYYQLRLSGLENSPEYLELEKQIEEIKNFSYERFKAEIDAIFDNTGN
jgi:molecular chaperone GrpE (heat shock protein)